MAPDVHTVIATIGMDKLTSTDTAELKKILADLTTSDPSILVVDDTYPSTYVLHCINLDECRYPFMPEKNLKKKRPKKNWDKKGY